MVYCPPATPADRLPSLLEVVASWALKFPRLIVLGDFSIQAVTASSQQAMNLVSLELSQIVLGSTSQEDHKDLDFDTEMVRYGHSDGSIVRSFFFEGPAGCPCLCCLNGKQIYACLQRLMELMPSSDSLDALKEGWNVCQPLAVRFLQTFCK